jgi:polyhydroxyalkanoate synthesis regulator phasin
MDEPVRRLLLALVGAVALTAERADELADSLAQRGGMSKEEVRAFIDEATTRWRGDAVRVGERAGATLNGAFRELGLVTRDEWDELELRVAQIEHRLRLVESRPRAVPPASSKPDPQLPFRAWSFADFAGSSCSVGPPQR